MTKRKPTNRKPDIQVIRGVKGNMLQHDIGIVATAKGYMFYIDPEIQIVLNHIIEEHRAVAIKINWHSSDLVLFIPPDIDQGVEAMAASAKDLLESQPSEVGKLFTPDTQNTATESETGG